MTVKLLTKHHLEFLTLKGGCTDSSESTLLKVTCRGSFVCIQPKGCFLICVEGSYIELVTGKPVIGILN